MLDCTLRDGGYYNNWDFSQDLIDDYVSAMENISMDYIEIGFRSLNSDGYKGACAYSTDTFLKDLNIPSNLNIAVMINAGEILSNSRGIQSALEQMFGPAEESRVSLVRIACHHHEILEVLPGIIWLNKNGYMTSINFMQIADRTEEEILSITRELSEYPLDVLYFADSMGSLSPDQTIEIINTLRSHWKGELGFHAHDNLGLGIINSIKAIENSVDWVDVTVLGMGRGPGNSKTEYMIIELDKYRKASVNSIKLYNLIKKYFKPMQEKYGWGTNPFYYLAGKHGIHPTYIQRMINDPRYDDADILAVIRHLKNVGGKKFSIDTMEAGRHFYEGAPQGKWLPSNEMHDREVLILGSGPSVKRYKQAIESFIKRRRPYVIALNTMPFIDPECIHVRAACHPIRLLADCQEHLQFPHPLVTPVSQLPESITCQMKEKALLDFGIKIDPDVFEFHADHCIIPTSQVIAYALAIATSGKARGLYLTGFDGYGADDPRTIEMDSLLSSYINASGSLPMTAITPTRYKIPSTSIYAL